MKFRRSTIVPCALLVYLAVMSVIGLPELRSGHYLYYFGIITVTLTLILLLHIFLKKRENDRK